MGLLTVGMNWWRPDELKSHLFLVHFSVLFSVIIE